MYDDLVGMMKATLKVKNGIRHMLKFLSDSRLTEKAACSLCEKKNCTGSWKMSFADFGDRMAKKDGTGNRKTREPE